MNFGKIFTMLMIAIVLITGISGCAGDELTTRKREPELERSEARLRGV